MGAAVIFHISNTAAGNTSSEIIDMYFMLENTVETSQ